MACSVCLLDKLLQSCLTLWDPIDCSPPGSSVQGILHARLLEWVSKSSSRRSSWSRNRTHLSCVSCIGRQILYHWATWEAPSYIIKEQIKDQIWNWVNLLIIGTIYTGEGNGNPLQYSCLENSLDEPGGLQSMGLQRVGHDWATSLSLSTLNKCHFSTVKILIKLKSIDRIILKLSYNLRVYL